MDTEKIYEVYMHACKLKDQAIKSEEIEYYTKASKELQEAIRLIDKIKEDKTIPEQLRLELMINQLYYNFEKENCLTVVFYEKRDISKAEEHHRKGIIFLRKSIKLAQKSLKLFNGEDKTEIERNMAFSRFLLSNSEGFKSSIKARYYWDKKDYILALDYYRKSVSQYYKTMEHFSNKNLEPKIERIVKGNFFGMMVNASNALAVIVLEKINEDSGKIPLHLLVKLFYFGLEAYKKSNMAFLTNPESEQYLKGAQVSMNNITETLKAFPLDIWRDLYLEFYDNEDFLRLMKKANLIKFRKLEKEFNNIYDSNLVIIANILFWLTYMAFPFISFKFFELIWWEVFLFMLLLFIVLIVINVIILRWKNKLSEESFIELIEIALKYTFKILEFAGKKFKK